MSKHVPVDGWFLPGKQVGLMVPTWLHGNAWPWIAGVAIAAISVLLGGCSALNGSGNTPMELPLLQRWQGDYPVAELGRLPENQRVTQAGYLGDPASFASVWQAFKADLPVPEVDFRRHLVIFSHNLHFYNRTFIAKVTLADGVAEVLAAETLSAIPIEDKVGMAMALVTRAGVQYLRSGEGRIPVVLGVPASAAGDPLNATYEIEHLDVRLVAGRAERPAAPGSATQVTTAVHGTPVYGDLDSDGDEDAAVLLVQAPGGTGAFYYIAVAVNDRGQYWGTNAVLLGDRVAPQSMDIRKGRLMANYSDRRPEDSMTTPPSVGRSLYLVLEGTRLTAFRGRSVVE